MIEWKRSRISGASSGLEMIERDCKSILKKEECAIDMKTREIGIQVLLSFMRWWLGIWSRIFPVQSTPTG